LEIAVYPCEDKNDSGAPDYCTQEVVELVTLEADLSSIPERNFQRRVGADGQEYYVMRFVVEVTYLSGQTNYVLLFRNQRYITVPTYE